MLEACAMSDISRSVVGVVTIPSLTMSHVRLQVPSSDDRDDSRARCVSPVTPQLENPGSTVIESDMLDTTTARKSPICSFQAPMLYKANRTSRTRARLPICVPQHMLLCIFETRIINTNVQEVISLIFAWRRHSMDEERDRGTPLFSQRLARRKPLEPRLNAHRTGDSVGRG